ncbi:MAG TPA: glycosyltransferase family 4 protein [Gaiellaceae bacterium]
MITSANFRPHVGGIERFVETLATGLAARGHDVKVLSCRPAGAAPREEVDGYEIVRAPATYVLEKRLGVPYPVPAPGLSRLLRHELEGVEVVHAQDALYATSVLALRTARRRQIPAVLTQHVAFVPQRNLVLDTAERAAIATLGRAARLAGAVVTLNPAVSSWVAKTWGIAEPRVLPVGVGPSGAAVDRRAVRRSLGLSEEGFLALFVGRDVPKKGLDVFLGATGAGVELVAVTDREGTSAGAALLPFMSADRLQQLLASADAFVLPSEGEGFPLTLQEAFTAGLPVVTTMQPGYDHYLSPDDVLVVERDPRSVREALVRLSGDRELQARLSARSRAVAERHFGLERFVSAYESLYEEVTAA